MTTVKATAPAKINLTLHITGQRDDGYHLLDSLVVFADVGDDLSATGAPDMRLSLSGPGTDGVPTDDTNLVMRAANLLRDLRGVETAALLSLHKYLPNGAGIGGGSSDAATTLAMLAKLWEVTPLSASTPEVLALGADVPVCMKAPKPVRMSGIGEVLASVPTLPEAALVLVNPGVTVPTGAVFDGLSSKVNRAMRPIPQNMDFDAFVDWLKEQRNDLLAPALKVAPEIDVAMAKLRAMPQVRFAGMSGSGSTCFGITRTMADARYVARAVQLAQQNWWVAPAMMLK